jgi:hypothetical protein
METTTIARGTLSPGLQQRLAVFDNQVTEYRQLQQQFGEIVKETKRLDQAAAALEAEAGQANASWKDMAKARTADQRKINTEIERSVQLKQDAEKYRRTASAREELHGEFVTKMAHARFALARFVEPLNQEYRGERIQKLLATEGLTEMLSELFELSAEHHFAEMALLEAHLQPSTIYEAEGRKRDAQWAFGRTLTQHIERERYKRPDTVIVYMPNAVKGEVVASSRVALMKLEKNGGRIPDDISANGGNYGPLRSLKTV